VFTLTSLFNLLALDHSTTMKIAFNSFMVAALFAVVNGASFRGEMETIDFHDVNQVASFNGIHAGEEILKQVNDIVDNTVNSDQLLGIAAKMEAQDPSLFNTQDIETAKIVDAFKQVTAKLFPGETTNQVIARLMPTLQQSGHLL
jgi:hypothetical protein